MTGDSIDLQQMRRALQLAARGLGHVEPNPQVGCVVAKGQQVLGQGWHRRFGGPHAEVEALRTAGESARGATLYVSLEPCCHQGKTPPCTVAITEAGIARVVIAQTDPFPEVAGKGVRQLRDAGIDVEVGLCADEAFHIIAPFRKRIEQQRPWVIAKWAMTLDGKLASRTGSSQWISSPESREIVHKLRGRVDAILVGSGTALHDDPLLTSRPPGPRVATRVVVDSQGRLPLESQLAKTARDVPVLLATGAACDPEYVARLENSGCEVVTCSGTHHLGRLDDLLSQLGQRPITNVLVEGGARLFGNLWELQQIDEVHVFIGTKLIGGTDAPSPIEGRGIDRMQEALSLESPRIQFVGPDVYVAGNIRRP